mmetsp:Transcript_4927/g.15646  ORF Transcript_4927/g.15646 Transcript_4927/m.15646 type:complete len:245 (+) Transcript_4927:324-1058(+)
MYQRSHVPTWSRSLRHPRASAGVEPTSPSHAPPPSGLFGTSLGDVKPESEFDFATASFEGMHRPRRRGPFFLASPWGPTAGVQCSASATGAVLWRTTCGLAASMRPGTLRTHRPRGEQPGQRTNFRHSRKRKAKAMVDAAAAQARINAGRKRFCRQCRGTPLPVCLATLPCPICYGRHKLGLGTTDSARKIYIRDLGALAAPDIPPPKVVVSSVRSGWQAHETGNGACRLVHAWRPWLWHSPGR